MLLVIADEFVQKIAANRLIENLEPDFEITKVTLGGECAMKRINE